MSLLKAVAFVIMAAVCAAQPFLREDQPMVYLALAALLLRAAASWLDEKEGADDPEATTRH